METASGIFNTCLDPKLIEIAIYEENIAKARLDYLIKEAKVKGVKCSIEDYYEYMNYWDDDSEGVNQMES